MATVWETARQQVTQAAAIATRDAAVVLKNKIKIFLADEQIKIFKTYVYFFAKKTKWAPYSVKYKKKKKKNAKFHLGFYEYKQDLLPNIKQLDPDSVFGAPVLRFSDGGGTLPENLRLDSIGKVQFKKGMGRGYAPTGGLDIHYELSYQVLPKVDGKTTYEVINNLMFPGNFGLRRKMAVNEFGREAGDTKELGLIQPRPLIDKFLNWYLTENIPPRIKEKFLT